RDVEGALALIRIVPEMGKRARVAGRPRRLRDTERRQCLGSYDPGRDGAAEALAEEGSQRLRLPLLDVARRPVVEETEADDMVPGLADRDRLAERIARPDPDGELELVIELAAGPIARRILVRRLALAARPANRDP